MRYPISICILFLLVQLIYCDSTSTTPEFQLILESDNSELNETSLYIDPQDDRLYIARNISEKEIVTGYLNSVGYLLLTQSAAHNYSGVAIGKNYLYPVGQSLETKYASPFTIKDGFLKLYSHDFHAVPSGVDGIHVIGSINAAAGRSDVIPIKIRANFLTPFAISCFVPPNYAGQSATISINTIPFMHHHKESNNSNLLINIFNIMFYLLNSTA